jgi:hypothetical protein
MSNAFREAVERREPGAKAAEPHHDAAPRQPAAAAA